MRAPATCQLLVLLGSIASRPGVALAYSDPSSFAASPLSGGGGGRFFTGSPADGYTCATCHAGGEPPKLQIAGLPKRYVPGATYEISMTWPASLADVAGVLELTDERGRGAGTLALPAQDAVHDTELCEPRAQRVPASQLYPADPQRTIATVTACGASAMRVQWTAPRSDVGPVWLAGSVVASDHKGDLRGDGVTSFAQPTPAFGKTLPEIVTRGGCAVVKVGETDGRREVPVLQIVYIVALGLLRSIARKRRIVIAHSLLLLVGLVLGGCARRDSLLERNDPVTIRPGDAVRPWDAAQYLSRIADAEVASDAGIADANVASDAGATDAGASDTGVAEVAMRDAAMLDAGPSAPVVFRVTTLSQGGQFNPKNIGAIWVAGADGKWVKTLAVWAGVSTRYLTRYCAANQTGNKIDAITSATLTKHQTHQVTWDLTDGARTPVADGPYTVLVEVTDHNGPGQLISVGLTKGGPSALIMPADSEYFRDVELRYTASSAAVGE